LKVALITGVTGQDGAYLSRLLLDRGYKVLGGYRRLSTANLWRIEFLDLLDRAEFELVELDVTDLSSCLRIIKNFDVQEIYNLAAQSFVGVSFDQPSLTADVTGKGALNLLEAIRLSGNLGIRFYQASTSEMFGGLHAPQSESTPFHPRSPYGVAKLFAHWSAINYRESYGIHASTGILFNHESPLRGIEFVTRKISDFVARYHVTGTGTMQIGNLDAIRDWGYAADYVEGMHSILSFDEPSDFVLATGVGATVREFVALAFDAVDISIKFDGSGLSEKGYNTATGDLIVEVSPTFFRPAEVDELIGDAERAKKLLHWEAVTPLCELCNKMVRADVERVGVK
jgi:GDPmannose 4,6-dehydratase